jgi:hypothetical protein
VPITVTIYNNICGRFEDQLIADVRGLGSFEFPVSIGIKGSPVDIPVNQVGVNYNSVPPTLPMPCQVVNSEPITKVLRVRNTGIRAVDINWEIYDQTSQDGSDRDQFNLKVANNQGADKTEAPYKFNFEYIEPKENLDSNFSVEPKQVTMGPREIIPFTVTFNPKLNGPGHYRSLVMASPSLTQEELLIAEDAEEFLKKGALGIVSFKLQA